MNQINHVWGGTTGYFWCCCFYFITFSQLDLNHSGIAMQKGLSIYLIVLFLDIRNLIPKEMLKSFSSPRDKQVAPDAIAKTDWTECAICRFLLRFQAFVWCWIWVQDLGWKYSKVQGSWFHAYEIDLSQLDEGDGSVENTLVRCKAHCHKSCYDLFNSPKLKWAEKKTCAWKWTTAWWKV